MAAMDEQPGDRAGDQISDDVRAVASFRPQVNDDGRPGLVEDHQREIRHLGRDAVRRAVVGAVVMGITVAVTVFVVVWLVADPGATIALGAAVGAGAFAAAVGGLWGAFSRLDSGDDWREAVTGRDP